MAGRKIGHFFMEKALNRLDFSGKFCIRVAVGQTKTITAPRTI
jgi:hypothetical protein